MESKKTQLIAQQPLSLASPTELTSSTFKTLPFDRALTQNIKHQKPELFAQWFFSSPNPAKQKLNKINKGLNNRVGDYQAGKISHQALATAIKEAQDAVRSSSVKESSAAKKLRRTIQSALQALQHKPPGSGDGWGYVAHLKKLRADILRSPAQARELQRKSGVEVKPYSFQQAKKAIEQTYKVRARHQRHWVPGAQQNVDLLIQSVNGTLGSIVKQARQSQQGLLVAIESFRQDPTPENLGALKRARQWANDLFNAGRLHPLEGAIFKNNIRVANIDIELGSTFLPKVKQLRRLRWVFKVDGNAATRADLNNATAELQTLRRNAIAKLQKTSPRYASHSVLQETASALSDAQNALKNLLVIGDKEQRNIASAAGKGTWVGVNRGGVLTQARIVAIYEYTGNKQWKLAHYRAVDFSQRQGSQNNLRHGKIIDYPAGMTLDDVKKSLTVELNNSQLLGAQQQPGRKQASSGAQIPTTGFIRPNSLNSMLPNTPDPGFRLPHEPYVYQQPYKLYPIKTLEFLDGRYGRSIDQHNFDVITNGTFFFEDGKKVYPSGPLVLDGKLRDLGDAKQSAKRGGVAILKDGTILMGRQNGSSLNNLRKQFGNVQHFMGGGVLLIENGKAVSHGDIFGIQSFTQATDMQTKQLRTTRHVVLAVRDGQAYLVMARNQNGARIQNYLLSQGFTTAVKFDGGKETYWQDQNRNYFIHKHPFGLGINVK